MFWEQSGNILGTSWEQTKNFSLYEILSVLFSVLSVYSAGSCAVSKAVTQHQCRATALVDLVVTERSGSEECACRGRVLCQLGACCCLAMTAGGAGERCGRWRNTAQGVFLGAPPSHAQRAIAAHRMQAAPNLQIRRCLCMRLGPRLVQSVFH